jgi:putative component of toxin-antitoxin plasmid stabilization module
LLEVREYINTTGQSPFTRWLRALDVQAAAKVATALERIADGNLSNVKGVVRGVLILLAGGTKKGQRQDIHRAQANWEDYRQRNKEGDVWR